MKKLLFLNLFIFISINLYCQIFANDLRTKRQKISDERRLYLGINEYVFAPRNINFSYLFYYDYLDGIKNTPNFILSSEVKLSRLFNFSLSTFLKGEQFFFDRFHFTWDLLLLKYLNFSLNYQFYNYASYKIHQHNLFIDSDVIFYLKQAAKIILSQGITFQFTDYNIFDQDYTFEQGWGFKAIFTWRITTIFYLGKYYSTGFELSNTHQDSVVSFGYIQLDYFHNFILPYNFELFANLGIGFSGSMSFAGVINRVWGGIGVKYKINFW